MELRKRRPPLIDKIKGTPSAAGLKIPFTNAHPPWISAFTCKASITSYCPHTTSTGTHQAQIVLHLLAAIASNLPANVSKALSAAQAEPLRKLIHLHCSSC